MKDCEYNFVELVTLWPYTWKALYGNWINHLWINY